ncbi:hypothetical protein K3495_g10867 [Podosphaera aphanis]|nr:hypothetical protein K3495_g10867 [Podosphaera aphanis]
MSDQDASSRLGISDVSLSSSSLSMFDGINVTSTSSSANLIIASSASPEPPDPLPTSVAPTSNSRVPSPSLHAAMSMVPALSKDVPPASSPQKHGPVLAVTLLLITGKRHPYKIDENFLNHRNIVIPGVTKEGLKDPYSISVYTFKELILREWKEEWDTRPSSPSSIRLIFFGRLLEDNTPLINYRFNKESPNIIHMMIRPQEITDDEDRSKSKSTSRNRDHGETTAGCRCAIM